MKKFNNIENIDLRTYNRCITFFNIIRDVSVQSAKNYLASLDDISKRHCSKFMNIIQEQGLSTVKKKVLRGIPILGEGV